MATREDDVFTSNAELFELMEKQLEIVTRLNKTDAQMKEIQSYLRDGPDALNKLRMAVKYDQEQYQANRKRIADLLSMRCPKTQ